MQMSIIDLIREKRDRRLQKGIDRPWIPLSLEEMQKTGWDRKILKDKIKSLKNLGHLEVKKAMPCDLYKIK